MRWKLSSRWKELRKSSWAVAALLLVGGLAFTSAVGPSASGGLTRSPRDISLTYLATVRGLPQDASQVQVWIPLAASREEQDILRREVHAPASYTITQDPVYHNDMLYLTLTPPIQEPLEIRIDYEIRLGRSHEAEPPPSADEIQRALEASGLVIIDDEVRARAQEAVRGRTAPIERARGIYDAVIQHMTYDKTTPGWGVGDTRRACLLGKGNCTDFHSLFISMARAERIPARFKIGLVVPPASSGVIPGYHCWAEFYVDGRGWVPVDASEAWKHPELADYYFGAQEPNRVLISVGRDLQLAPPQRDKPVNIFFSPYVEVDGIMFQQVRTEFYFRELPPEISRSEISEPEQWRKTGT
jgi:transglutaminase-like putative cysteine protease